MIYYSCLNQSKSNSYIGALPLEIFLRMAAIRFCGKQGLLGFGAPEGQVGERAAVCSLAASLSISYKEIQLIIVALVGRRFGSSVTSMNYWMSPAINKIP